MTECEICGSNAIKKAEIDGAIINVCSECVKYGKTVAGHVKIRTKPTKDINSSRYIDPKYSELIKDAREKREMKIDELAKKINEKESVISSLERGHLSPSFNLAKKLENFLEIKLILEYNEEFHSSKGKRDNSLTIGDVVDLGELDD